MWRLIIRIRNFFGVVAIVLLLLGLAGLLAGQMLKPGVPAKVVLELDLERELVEYKPADPFAQAMLQDSASLLQVTHALERASKDDRVVALVARIGEAPIGFATAQEIRQAVLRFRKAGKKAIAFSETFGEFGPGNLSYFIASAFDEIHLQPSGDLGLIGLSADSLFLRGAFDKLELGLRADHRHEFKNAKNLFTERGYTDAHRQSVTSLLTSIYDQMVASIAEGRKLDGARVRELVDAGPYLGPETVKAGLVDKLSYWDEVRASLDSAFGEDSELLYASKYLERAGGPFDSGEVIALVHGVGTVQRGSKAYDPLSGYSMSSGAVTAALRAAASDDQVKAIVFRVNSGGGSYVASDSIWREVDRAKAAGKPVIISMGDAAASGGYFVAMNANKIVADPGTITGSIGVLNVKVLTRDFWKRFGITFDNVTLSKRATIYSSLHDFDEGEWNRFQAWLDRIYDDFTSKVARGRKLDKKVVLEIAKGRVWTGVQAKEHGLVDELGGLITAIEVAKTEAQIDADADVELRMFPRPKTPLQMLSFEGPDNSDPAVGAVVSAVKALRPVVDVASEINGPPVTLEAPALEIR